MNATPRPTGVTVIGWSWIILGILMIFSGAMGLFAYLMLNEAIDGYDLPPHAPSILGASVWIFENFVPLIIAQTLIALIAVIGGIQFLRRRVWARVVLEVLSWLSLVYVVGFGIFSITAWLSITGSLPADQIDVGVGFFRIFGIAVVTIITAIFAVSLGITIKYLRSSIARNAMVR